MWRWPFNCGMVAEKEIQIYISGYTKWSARDYGSPCISWKSPKHPKCCDLHNNGRWNCWRVEQGAAGVLPHMGWWWPHCPRRLYWHASHERHWCRLIVFLIKDILLRMNLRLQDAARSMLWCCSDGRSKNWRCNPNKKLQGASWVAVRPVWNLLVLFVLSVVILLSYSVDILP